MKSLANSLQLYLLQKKMRDTLRAKVMKVSEVESVTVTVYQIDYLTNGKRSKEDAGS